MASAEAKFNPRLRNSIGNLSKAPPARRVAGPGASWVMAPFVHCSPLRPGRFFDGSFGLRALLRRRQHRGSPRRNRLPSCTLHASHERGAGLDITVRELIGSIDGDHDDATGQSALLDLVDYGPSQTFGAERRASGSNGITWPSIRYLDGKCIAAFWPDVVPTPTQGAHYAYHWNGTEVDFVKKRDSGEVASVAIQGVISGRGESLQSNGPHRPQRLPDPTRGRIPAAQERSASTRR